MAIIYGASEYHQKKNLTNYFCYYYYYYLWDYYYSYSAQFYSERKVHYVKFENIAISISFVSGDRCGENMQF
jgi:hypothetical protein